MDMIRQIAVIGAGAVGSFFLKGWKDWQEGQVFAVAEGSRKDRLEQEGLVVNGERNPLCVRTPEEASGSDLIVICVKYGALSQAIDMAVRIADSHTIILCPMNGVDTEELIAQHMGRQHILHSLMYIAAERAGNQIHIHDGVTPRIYYGRAEGFGEISDLETVRELLDTTGICSQYQTDIMAAMWKKFTVNISTNIAQAVVGCNYGAYKTSPFVNRLGQLLCDEVMSVAHKKGISFTYDFQESLRSPGPDDTAHFSTLQDLMAKRETEVDMFCGAVMRMGKECGIRTPYNEFAYLTIKALEEMNRGSIS